MRQFGSSRTTRVGPGRWTSTSPRSNACGLTGVDLMQVIEGTLIEKFIRDPGAPVRRGVRRLQARGGRRQKSPTRSSARRWRATPSRPRRGGAG